MNTQSKLLSLLFFRWNQISFFVLNKWITEFRAISACCSNPKQLWFQWSSSFFKRFVVDNNFFRIKILNASWLNSQSFKASRKLAIIRIVERVGEIVSRNAAVQIANGANRNLNVIVRKISNGYYSWNCIIVSNVNRFIYYNPYSSFFTLPPFFRFFGVFFCLAFNSGFFASFFSPEVQTSKTKGAQSAKSRRVKSVACYEGIRSDNPADAYNNPNYPVNVLVHKQECRLGYLFFFRLTLSSAALRIVSERSYFILFKYLSPSAMHSLMVSCFAISILFEALVSSDSISSEMRTVCEKVSFGGGIMPPNVLRINTILQYIKWSRNYSIFS